MCSLGHGAYVALTLRPGSTFAFLQSSPEQHETGALAAVGMPVTCLRAEAKAN